MSDMQQPSPSPSDESFEMADGMSLLAHLSSNLVHLDDQEQGGAAAITRGDEAWGQDGEAERGRGCEVTPTTTRASLEHDEQVDDVLEEAVAAVRRLQTDRELAADVVWRLGA